MLRFGGLCACVVLAVLAFCADGWARDASSKNRRFAWPVLRNVLVGECVVYRPSRTSRVGNKRARYRRHRPARRRCERLYTVGIRLGRRRVFERLKLNCSSADPGCMAQEKSRRGGQANARAGARGASVDTAHRARRRAPGVDDRCSSWGWLSPVCCLCSLALGAAYSLASAAAVALPQPRHRPPRGYGRRPGRSRAFCASRRLVVVFKPEHTVPLGLAGISALTAPRMTS